jgi:hypothetical protein
MPSQWLRGRHSCCPLEREALRENPTTVVLVELGRRDLHITPIAKMEPLRNWKAT